MIAVCATSMPAHGQGQRCNDAPNGCPNVDGNKSNSLLRDRRRKIKDMAPLALREAVLAGPAQAIVAAVDEADYDRSTSFTARDHIEFNFNFAVAEDGAIYRDETVCYSLRFSKSRTTLKTRQTSLLLFVSIGQQGYGGRKTPVEFRSISADGGTCCRELGTWRQNALPPL